MGRALPKAPADHVAADARALRLAPSPTTLRCPGATVPLRFCSRAVHHRLLCLLTAVDAMPADTPLVRLLLMSFWVLDIVPVQLVAVLVQAIGVFLEVIAAQKHSAAGATADAVTFNCPPNFRVGTQAKRLEWYQLGEFDSWQPAWRPTRQGRVCGAWLVHRLGVSLANSIGVDQVDRRIGRYILHPRTS